MEVEPASNWNALAFASFGIILSYFIDYLYNLIIYFFLVLIVFILLPISPMSLNAFCIWLSNISNRILENLVLNLSISKNVFVFPYTYTIDSWIEYGILSSK